MNKNLLMSFEEYSRTKHEVPYFYTMQTNGQMLFYFGSTHSNNPNHPQYTLLKEKWNDFLNKTENKKRLVIIEAQQLSSAEQTLDESINKRGEVGAGLYFASETNIKIISGEPSNEESFEYLLEKFSKEEILLYYMAIAIKHWLRNKNGKSLEDFLSKQTDKYRVLLNWPELVVSVELIRKIYKEIFNQELDIDDEKIYNEITTPVVIKSRINELSRSQSIFRNKYILEQIEKYWNEEYNIFIIYGAGHALMQEPAIRSLIN